MKYKVIFFALCFIISVKGDRNDKSLKSITELENENPHIIYPSGSKKIQDFFFQDLKPSPLKIRKKSHTNRKNKDEDKKPPDLTKNILNEPLLQNKLDVIEEKETVPSKINLLPIPISEATVEAFNDEKNQTNKFISPALVENKNSPSDSSGLERDEKLTPKINEVLPTQETIVINENISKEDFNILSNLAQGKIPNETATTTLKPIIIPPVLLDAPEISEQQKPSTIVAKTPEMTENTTTSTENQTLEITIIDPPTILNISKILNPLESIAIRIEVHKTSTSPEKKIDKIEVIENTYENSSPKGNSGKASESQAPTLLNIPKLKVEKIDEPLSLPNNLSLPNQIIIEKETPNAVMETGIIKKRIIGNTVKDEVDAPTLLNKTPEGIDVEKETAHKKEINNQRAIIKGEKSTPPKLESTTQEVISNKQEIEIQPPPLFVSKIQQESTTINKPSPIFAEFPFLSKVIEPTGAKTIEEEIIQISEETSTSEVETKPYVSNDESNNEKSIIDKRAIDEILDTITTDTDDVVQKIKTIIGQELMALAAKNDSGTDTLIVLHNGLEIPEIMDPIIAEKAELLIEKIKGIVNNFEDDIPENKRKKRATDDEETSQSLNNKILSDCSSDFNDTVYQIYDMDNADLDCKSFSQALQTKLDELTDTTDENETVTDVPLDKFKDEIVGKKLSNSRTSKINSNKSSVNISKENENSYNSIFDYIFDRKKNNTKTDKELIDIRINKDRYRRHKRIVDNDNNEVTDQLLTSNLSKFVTELSEKSVVDIINNLPDQCQQIYRSVIDRCPTIQTLKNDNSATAIETGNKITFNRFRTELEKTFEDLIRDEIVKILDIADDDIKNLINISKDYNISKEDKSLVIVFNNKDKTNARIAPATKNGPLNPNSLNAPDEPRYNAPSRSYIFNNPYIRTNEDQYFVWTRSKNPFSDQAEWVHFGTKIDSSKEVIDPRVKQILGVFEKSNEPMSERYGDDDNDAVRSKRSVTENKIEKISVVSASISAENGNDRYKNGVSVQLPDASAVAEGRIEAGKSIKFLTELHLQEKEAIENLFRDNLIKSFKEAAFGIKKDEAEPRLAVRRVIREESMGEEHEPIKITPKPATDKHRHADRQPHGRSTNIHQTVSVVVPEEDSYTISRKAPAEKIIYTEDVVIKPQEVATGQFLEEEQYHFTGPKTSNKRRQHIEAIKKTRRPPQTLEEVILLEEKEKPTPVTRPVIVKSSPILNLIEETNIKPIEEQPEHIKALHRQFIANLEKAKRIPPPPAEASRKEPVSRTITRAPPAAKQDEIKPIEEQPEEIQKLHRLLLVNLEKSKTKMVHHGTSRKDPTATRIRGRNSRKQETKKLPEEILSDSKHLVRGHQKGRSTNIHQVVSISVPEDDTYSINTVPSSNPKNQVSYREETEITPQEIQPEIVEIPKATTTATTTMKPMPIVTEPETNYAEIIFVAPKTTDRRRQHIESLKKNKKHVEMAQSRSAPVRAIQVVEKREPIVETIIESRNAEVKHIESPVVEIRKTKEIETVTTTVEETKPIPQEEKPIETQSEDLKELHKLYLETLQKALTTRTEPKPKVFETTVQVVKPVHHTESDIHPPPNMPGGTQERFRTTKIRIEPDEFDEDDDEYIRKKNYEEQEEIGKIHQSYLDALVSAYKGVQPIEETQKNSPKTILSEFKRSEGSVGSRQARTHETSKNAEMDALFRTRRSTEDEERKINFEKQKLHTRVNRGWNRHHARKPFDPETQEFSEEVEKQQEKKPVNRNRGHVVFRKEDHLDELFMYTSTSTPEEMDNVEFQFESEKIHTKKLLQKNHEKLITTEAKVTTENPVSTATPKVEAFTPSRHLPLRFRHIIIRQHKVQAKPKKQDDNEKQEENSEDTTEFINNKH